MQPSADHNFSALVELLKEVKPGIGDRDIKPSDSVVDDLGLDSLDILQLSRKITRRIGGFDLDEWSQQADEHNRSVESLLSSISAPVGA